MGGRYERRGMRQRSQDIREDINKEIKRERGKAAGERGDQRGSHFTPSAIRYRNQALL